MGICVSKCSIMMKGVRRVYSAEMLELDRIEFDQNGLEMSGTAV